MKTSLKDIPGYEGKYAATQDGRIWSHRSKMFLTPYVSGRVGRECYYVKLLGKNKTVHRLIALTYIENPENKAEVDHINRNRFDNSVDNLRWATSEENHRNMSINKKIMDCKTGKVYDSVAAAAEDMIKLGLCRGKRITAQNYISSCLGKNVSSAYGRAWRYVNEDSQSREPQD